MHTHAYTQVLKLSRIASAVLSQEELEASTLAPERES
jgi:hypothetical protein